MRYFAGPSGREDYGSSPAEIVGSNPTGAWMSVFCECCVLPRLHKKLPTVGLDTTQFVSKRLLLVRVHLPGLHKEICR